MLNDLNDQVREIDKLEQQRLNDAGITKAVGISRRPIMNNSGRPRTPIEDAANPFEKLKMEEELAKYKRYIQFDLPDIVTKQVNDIFEKEESGLKSLMKERDQLLRMQLGSFHDYLSIMDQSRVREINDMNNLKLEVDEMKRANDGRVQQVQKAFLETDKMLSNEADWKQISSNYNPQSFHYGKELAKPYSLDLDKPWNEDKYLKSTSQLVDLRREVEPESSNLRRIQSNYLEPMGSSQIMKERDYEPDNMRKSRINDIIHELDHIMDDMNDPSLYRVPKAY